MRGFKVTMGSNRGKAPNRGPISDRANNAGKKFLIPFCGLFVVVGLALLYPTFIRPLMRVQNAKTWDRVFCTIMSSEVRTHSDSDGNTYSVHVLYHYRIGGKEFNASRYDFMGGSSSGYSKKAEIVARHPPGRIVEGFVNPADPTDAVLVRGFVPMMWFGLIPLAFVCVGSLGIIFTLRSRRAAPQVTLGNASAETAPTRDGMESLVLKPAHGAVGKFIGIVLAAAFWNGIVSIFVVTAVKSWRTSDPEWLLTLFMIPFVLIGAGLIGGVVYFFLALFNPRAHVTLSPGQPSLGQPILLQWQFSGRTSVLQGLRVWLEGREEATYRRGTSTRTDTNVFSVLMLFEGSAAAGVTSGSARVTVPAHLMHSFASHNNKIVWVIRVEGDIQRWPDVNEEFPITIRPAPIGAMQT